MYDPVAEAAAQIAAQQAEPSMLEKAMDTIHDLEAKVEHLIHPETETTAGTMASGQPETFVPNVVAAAWEATSGATVSDTALANSGSEPGNVVAAAGAGEPVAGAAPADGGDLPNAVSAVAESTTATASAPSASGSGETSSIGASSDEILPLHARVADHLEQIYRMVKEAAPAPIATDTSVLKTHVGDILHRISNGMAVSEGELVQKLEALYRML